MIIQPLLSHTICQQNGHFGGKVVNYYGRYKNRLGSVQTCKFQKIKCGDLKFGIHVRNFSLQVQLTGFNADLYENFTTASREPNGLFTVSVLMEVNAKKA